VIHSQNYREVDVHIVRQSVNSSFLCWRRSHLLLAFSIAVTLATLAVCVAGAQQISSDLYSGMHWRLIGPHRAGRVTAVAGIAGQPNEYYFGTPGGGVWKTTDGGRVWKPVFDAAHVASIGALAVAPSDPRVLYVGTGEQTQGSGLFKSTDAGATWTNAGLADTHYIDALLVDPSDANMVLAGASGDSSAKSSTGVFRSADGGKTWTKVLAKDDRIGAVDLCFDPNDPRVVYAALSSLRPERGKKGPEGPGSWIYKSTDKGVSWQPAGETGLPSEDRGRIGVAVAPGLGGRRMFAIMNQGLFRSDDAGATWQRITQDTRIIGNFYFSRVFVDPKNADVVYVMQTSSYRSTDGGKTFVAFAGAPSGEDHHVVWIAPNDPQRMLLGTDQGAAISVDGGKSWSDWFNQPTGQFYHVTTDNLFPYRAYAAQQDCGTAVVPSRSDFGEITYRDWYSAGGFESGYIAPDPLKANDVYSIGWYGIVLRLDRSTGQIATVYLPPASYRTAWETPLVFSPRDPHALYYGAQYVLKTTDGAMTWKVISPDLTGEPEKPSETKKPAGGHEPEEEEGREAQSGERGVILTIAPSPLSASQIWAGTSTGTIHLTRDDGVNWQNVTPAGLPAKSRVLLIEASPFDASVAYAAVAAQHDTHPYFYRTHDAGKNWDRIVTGLPEFGIARAVRGDPARRGLLYAGTETGVYVSWDSGDHWQSLQLDLPTASVRDLAVHGGDLVAATFGRALWILDDLAPLRQAGPAVATSAAHLFRPETAPRVRWDNHPDTPLSADLPAGENPPDGVILDYYLKSAPKGEITLDILDGKKNRIRRYSSIPPAADARLPNAPDYWFAPPEVLSTQPGMQRVVWNLRYEHPPSLTYSFYGNLINYIEYTLPDHAIPGHTPRYQPEGALVVPGRYEAVLTVDGKSISQPLSVELDPRVHATAPDLAAQSDLALQIADAMTASYNVFNDAAALRKEVSARQKDLTGNAQAKEVQDALGALEKQIAEVADGMDAAPGAGPANRDLTRYFIMIESADIRPPDSARAAAKEACQALQKNLEQWRKLNAEAVPALNKQLELSKLKPVPAAENQLTSLACAN
jgi:photosystem II stability/assembly factor-like uncharacterized protein